MAKLVVGPGAKHHIARLTDSIVTLHYGPRHGFSIHAKHAEHSEGGRVLQVGPLAKLRLKTLGRKIVTAHWSAQHGFWVTTVAVPLSKRQIAVGYANEALPFAGEMVYDEGPERSQLFNRNPGDYKGAHADCSQFVSSIMHWSGVEDVNQWDDTGTLLEKGSSHSEPAIARLIIAGSGTGVHVGMFTEKINGVWMIVEFGDQAAPDQISESNFMLFFRNRGVYEFRYRDFF
jgi:hypothetical protein